MVSSSNRTMAKVVFPKQTAVVNPAVRDEASKVQELTACFKEVGKFKVAGAALSEGSLQFPDALNYMTKGKRVIGSEPHIIRTYLDCIVKLQLLHAAVLASTVPELSMPKPMRAKSVNNLEIVPFSEARSKVPIVCAEVPVQSGYEPILKAMYASEFLTWLFGPSIKIFCALKSGAPLFMWLFNFVPILIPLLIIRYFMGWAVTVILRPELIVDAIIYVLSLVPEYLAYSVSRVLERCLPAGLSVIANGNFSEVAFPPMSSTEVPLAVASAGAFWLLGRVGR